MEENEELVLNTMATINNLSFYNTKSNAITRRQLQLANCKYRVMVSEDYSLTTHCEHLICNIIMNILHNVFK